MEVIFFQILVIAVTFYIYHVLTCFNMLCNVLIKNVKTNIFGTGGLKVKINKLLSI